MKDAGVQDRADGAVDAAVARVLLAEQEARAAVEQAHAEAGRIAERARAQARAVARRSRERIERAHARLQQAVRAELAAIEAESRALPDHDGPDAGARARLERALQALAESLTAGPEGARS